LEAELQALEDEKASKGHGEEEMAQTIEERDLAVNALKRAEDGVKEAKDETRMIEKLLEAARVETEQMVATKDERIAHLEV
jgi:hypothetical protein